MILFINNKYFTIKFDIAIPILYYFLVSIIFYASLHEMYEMDIQELE